MTILPRNTLPSDSSHSQPDSASTLIVVKGMASLCVNLEIPLSGQIQAGSTGLDTEKQGQRAALEVCGIEKGA